jgi:hypothetical protein
MPTTASTPRPPVYRLVHSSGDSLVTDRNEALSRLNDLPGAKLFVLAE